MKIISAIAITPSMTEEEIDSFLESKLNLQLASIDKKGDPIIQPIWFRYDKKTQNLFNDSQNVKEDPKHSI